jgi:hypothetical protein
MSASTSSSKAVLQRQHQRFRPDQFDCAAHRGVGIERLDQHNDQIDDTGLSGPRRGVNFHVTRAVPVVYP